MSIFRLTTITLSLTILVACGGGGGSSTAVAPTAPPTTGNPNTPPTTGDPNMPPTGGGEVVNPLAALANVNVVADSSSSTIQAVEGITGMMGAEISVSPAYQTGNLNKIDSACSMTTCGILIPEVTTDSGTSNRDRLSFSITNPHTSLFLLNNAERLLNNTDSIFMVTEGVAVDGITFARGNATPSFVSGIFNRARFEFRTFAGWIDQSIFFGATQMELGETERVNYFVNHVVGVPSGTDPEATGGSATWEGATVASIKANRTFILGDATVTVNFTDENVDLMFDDWRGLDNQAVSSVPAISYEDLTLTDGAFEGSGNDQVEGRFYGTEHAEVGGFFNTETVTGAFGGTRQ